MNREISVATHVRMVARENYAWEHRMELDPLEGFNVRPEASTTAARPATGEISFTSPVISRTDLVSSVIGVAATPNVPDAVRERTEARVARARWDMQP